MLEQGQRADYLSYEREVRGRNQVWRVPYTRSSDPGNTLIITYFSLGGKHSCNQSLHLCKSDKKKHTEEDKYPVELHTPIYISKWQTELGEGSDLLAGLQTHDQRPKAGHSEIKHLVLESDHWNKAAFHLREGIIIHSFS